MQATVRAGRYMKILIPVDNLEDPTVTAVEINGEGQETEAPECLCATDGKEHHSKKHLDKGMVVYAESSPGCVYWIGGTPVKVC